MKANIALPAGMGRHFSTGIQLVVCAWLVAAWIQPASAITFNLVNNDGPGEGFNDPTLGAARIAAFEFALDIWEGIIQEAYVGEVINVNAEFNSLGGSPSSATLGSAGAELIHANFSSMHPEFQSNTWYGSPLANHLAGSDLNGLAEISATFNSDVDNATVLGGLDWYYGTDANPGGDIDFVTVVLHEIGHGMNFFDVINSSDGSFISNIPGIYDRFLELGDGTDFTSMSDAQRLAALTSEDVFWNGPDATAANSGVMPEIYAPSPFEPGSSIAHLDETVFPNELMSPLYSGPDHTISDLERGMLSDMGWTLVPTVPEPTTGWLLSLVLGGLASTRRR